MRCLAALMGCGLLLGCHPPQRPLVSERAGLDSGLSATGNQLELSLRVLRGSGPSEQTLDDQDILHTGDRLRLALYATQPAYLYVVHFAADGTATQLFPSGGYSQIPARCRVLLPLRSSLLVQDPPGEAEELRVVASLRPLPALDRRLCEELQIDCKAAAPPPVVAPCAAPPPLVAIADKGAQPSRRLALQKVVVGKDAGQGVSSLRYTLRHQ